MRRLLVLLPAVAIAAAATAAVVVAAGPSGAGAGTVGYTVYFPPTAGAVETTDATTEATAPEPFRPSGDVGAAQGSCSGQLATVDLASGVVTPLSAPPSNTACAGDLAFAPDGTLYGLVQSGDFDAPQAELVRFDTTTGAATAVGVFGPFQFSLGGTGEGPSGGIAFDATGTLYAELGALEPDGYDPQCATEEGQNWCLYRVLDPSTPGVTEFVGRSTGGDEFAQNLAATCDNMYTSTFTLPNSESSEIHAISTQTAALTTLGALGPGRFLTGADFDFSGTLWGQVIDTNAEGNPFSLVTIDTAGGTPIETDGPPLTVEGDDEPFFDGLAIQPLECAQPEPIVLVPTFTG